jgi:GNAT superfamily N-acetyltransferase
VPADGDAIERMSLALNAEDPGPNPVPPDHVRRTLAAFAADPRRGRALVLEDDSSPCGYAFLIPFWSNELGGEVCVVDEIYVVPAQRGRGHATRLFDTLASRAEPWLAGVVALALETTPDNSRARRLYERAGFSARNLAMRRLLPR